jgi:hypothetical protein
MGRAVPWTEEEDNILREYYPTNDYTSSDIGKMVGRGASAVRARATKLGLTKPSGNWTKEQDNIIRRFYPDKTVTLTEIALMINKKAMEVKTRAGELKVKRDTAWTKEEVKKLSELYVDMDLDVDTLDKYFVGRSIKSIKSKAKSLKLRRPVNYWTEEEDDFIRRVYNDTSYTREEIAEAINRTVPSLATRAVQLGITREADVPPGMKQCGHCREILPMDADHFHKNGKSSGDGFSNRCKECVSKTNREKKRLKILEDK